MTLDDTRPSPADQAADLHEHLLALEAYRRAVEEIAKVDALIEQAVAKRATLAASVREAQQAMRATDPARARRPGPRASRSRPHTGAAAVVLTALPATLAELVESTGLTRPQIKNALQRLKSDGQAGPSPDGVWRPTTEG